MDAAKYYDKIYSFKDYEREASKIARVIKKSLETDYPRNKTTGYSASFILT